MNNIKYFQTRWRENITHTDMLATFFLFTAFFFVSLENFVVRNFLRVLFLVIFPAILKKKFPQKEKYIYIAANCLPAKIYPE